MRRIVRLAQLTLLWNVIVIVLGAWVRASGSGAGCGRSWPTCQGELLPVLEGHTAVEFIHRASSGIALVLVAWLVLAVFRATQPGHLARKGAVWTGVAILAESAIGAVLVLYELVDQNDSVARVVSVPLHLVNTMLLLAALTLTVFWLGGGGRLRPVGDGTVTRWVVVVGLSMLVLSGTGAVTALADTLFPKDSFTLAGTVDVSAGEHFLTRLRIIHPVVAILVGVWAALWARWNALPRKGRPAQVGRVVIGLVAIQMVAGVLNVVLLAPIWLQLVHLALADALWIAWVWLSAELLQPRLVGFAGPLE